VNQSVGRRDDADRMGARTGKDCEGTRYEEPPGKPKSSCRIKRQCLVEKAAFFGDFLCRRKESYPPAGEAATA
jgi:hypothetical protein